MWYEDWKAQEVQGSGEKQVPWTSKRNPATSKPGGKGPCTYANFLIYEMSGHLDLLRDAPDGEYS